MITTTHCTSGRHLVRTSSTYIALRLGFGGTMPFALSMRTNRTDGTHRRSTEKSVELRFQFLRILVNKTCSESNYTRFFCLIFRSEFGEHEFSHSLDRETTHSQMRSAYLNRRTEKRPFV